MNALPASREHVAAFDVLRTVAAAAVVIIHVLGPYRDRLGDIPDSFWSSAIALNGVLRWAVPVFIMITGALILSDERPFDPVHYLRRRVAKVLVPFLFWSLVYAVVAGVSPNGFDGEIVTERLVSLPTHETYYHLGFFYYFIPLYLIAPPLSAFVQRAPTWAVVGLLALWLALTSLYLAGGKGFWSLDFVLFGGYLVLGFVLWRLGSPPLWLLGVGAIAVLVVGDVAVIRDSLHAGRYDTGRWFSYKTVNTVLVATFVFVLALRVSPQLVARPRGVFEFIGRHSLGIYFLHPLFLWPVRAFDLYGGHPLLVIPAWALLAAGLALAASVVLSRLRATAWMVP